IEPRGSLPSTGWRLSPLPRKPWSARIGLFAHGRRLGLPLPLPEIAVMSASALVPSLDLATLARLYQTGECKPSGVITCLVYRLAQYPDPAVWTHRLPDQALMAQVEAALRRRAAGDPLPLYGVPFAIKDVIDFADCPTTAACPAFAYAPA